MIFDSLIELLNKKLVTSQFSSLTRVEVLLLQGIWENVTYSEIGQQESYSSGYLTKVVAPKLYKKLSNLIGEDVSKRNCRLLLKSYIASHTNDIPTYYPSGAVALDSNLYIKRTPVEDKIYQELDRPGALIRIKGSRGVGKTSLLLRILKYANQKDYSVVNINLAQIDSEIFSNLDRFLRFLCIATSHQMKREPKLDEYWDTEIGSKVSCSLYLRYYLLEQSDRPIVFAFDKIDRIFEYRQLAQDFLPLVRSWYEEGKRTPCWQKLRMIGIHTTEIPIPLQVHQSPCNVGLPIELQNFNVKQVEELVTRYQLNWQMTQNTELLTNFVGGHPSLIQIALYHLSRREITLSELLETATNSESIFYNHLLGHWLTLQKKTKLAKYLNKLLESDDPVFLDPIAAYKLRGMGLIKPIGDRVTISCELYRRYFSQNTLKITELE